jgi:signal peptidase I
VHIEDGGVYVNNQRLDEAYLPGAELEHSDAPMTVVLEPGEYFVLGDNRRDSKDSRRFGAIEDESVIGVAVVRFWPLSEFGLLQ